MKRVKIVGMFLTLVLVFSIVLAYAKTTEAREKMTLLKIVSSAIGSGTYVNIVAMSSMVETKSKWLRLTPIPTPGWVDALRLVKDNRAGIAGTGALEIAAMMAGVAPFKGEKYTDLLWLWPTMFPVTTVLAKKNSQIHTLQDLKNAAIGMNPPGTSAEKRAKVILNVLGFEPKKIVYLSYTDQVSALKDGTVNVVIASQAIGSPQMIELTTVNDCNIIPLDDETWEKIEVQKLGYSRVKLPAGTYRLQDKDVLCMSTGGYMVASKRLSDKVVYEVTRCFWDDFEEQTLPLNPTVLGECRDAVKTALADPGPCPIHPGALRYFKEKGMLK